MKNREPSKNIIKRIWSYFSKHKLSIVTVVILSVFESLITVISPKIAGEGITILSMTNSFGKPDINMERLFRLLASLLALYSVEGFCSCFGRYIFTNVSTKVVYDLRSEISHKIHRLSFKYLENKTRGDILSCVVNDAEMLSSSLIDNVRSLISSLVISIGTIYMMFSISWEITLVSFCVLPLIVLTITVLIKLSQKHFIGYRQKLAEINSCIEESFSGYETIKVFGTEKNVLEKFDSINELLYENLFESNFRSGLMAPIMEFLSKVLYVVCCIFGGYLSVTKGLAIGDITAFMTYSAQFINPFMTISGISANFQAVFASSNRIFEFLDAPEEQVCGSLLNELNFTDKKIDVEFRNVSFSYNGVDNVIKDFSFKIKPGQTVAIVGETGGGKTTLIKLLMRFYNVTEGEILINGKNINSLDIDDYRKNFSIVTQDSWLYSSSIMENIRYGNLDASDEEIKKVADFVGVSNSIESLPNGYNTVIEENASNLSEGQKQLICIARAVLSNRQIFILDEATASVDTFTESCLQKSLSKIFKNKTSIIIAHRPQTIRDADVALVIQDGYLAEWGNHTQLMNKHGVYYDMYKGLN